MATHKSSLVHPKYKTKYRVGNWTEVDRGLRSRGIGKAKRLSVAGRDRRSRLIAYMLLQ